MSAMAGFSRSTRFCRPWLLFFLGIFSVAGANFAAKADESLEVMRAFTEQEVQVSDEVKIADKKKHQILFIMGVFLLIGILTTAALGIAMVLFGKQVFVAHMIFAGFSSFLAVAHAVVAIVWFFPF